MAKYGMNLDLTAQKESTMRIAPFLLITCLGYGCAAKKMTAQHADVLLEHQIEKRLPLYSAQKEQLSKDVNKFLNAQKSFVKEAIPIITSIELDPKKVDDQYKKINALYNKLVTNFSAIISKYMTPLDEKQQKDFQKILEAENQALKSSKSNDRMEKLNERFEIMFGSISSKQRKLLKEHGPYLEERHKVRMDRREQLQDRFKDIFKMDLSKDAKQNYFNKAFTDYQENYPETSKNIEIIKDIIPTLSIEQKEVFEDKINDLKDILNYYLESTY